MQCVIFRNGTAAGTLRIEDEGLYRTLSAELEYGEQILRLYLWGQSFGVLAPEDGALRLRRRVSRQRMPVLPAYAVAWCEADGQWLPEGAGLRRFTPEGRELAIRWRTDGPMAFPAAPEKLRMMKLEGAYHLVCALPYLDQ